MRQVNVFETSFEILGEERRRNKRAFGIAGSEGYGACRDAMLEFEYAAVLRDRIIELRGEK